MKIRLSELPLAPELVAQIEAAEGALVVEVGSRPDTFTLSFEDDGQLVGYAVFGPQDDSGFFNVYAARSMMRGLAQMAMVSLFGAASVAKRPVRVHSDKLRAVARMMGANDFLTALDGDGLRVGVLFHG